MMNWKRTLKSRSIGNIKNLWEIKKVHWKHGNETGNKNEVSKHSFDIGNIIRK